MSNLVVFEQIKRETLTELLHISNGNRTDLGAFVVLLATIWFVQLPHNAGCISNISSTVFSFNLLVCVCRFALMWCVHVCLQVCISAQAILCAWALPLPQTTQNNSNMSEHVAQGQSPDVCCMCEQVDPDPMLYKLSGVHVWKRKSTLVHSTSTAQFKLDTSPIQYKVLIWSRYGNWCSNVL